MFQKHRRNSLRWKSWDYSWGGYYFFTIKTNGNFCLGNVDQDGMHLSKEGKIVQKIWLDLPKYYDGCHLDEFIVMPDHLHGIIVINNDNKIPVGAVHEPPIPVHEPSIPVHELSIRSIKQKTLQNCQTRRRMLLCKIIGRLKMQSAKQINVLHNCPGQAFWQRGFYDEVILDGIGLMLARRYIRNNPRVWYREILKKQKLIKK